jgi:hypothetical protein
MNKVKAPSLWHVVGDFCYTEKPTIATTEVFKMIANRCHLFLTILCPKQKFSLMLIALQRGSTEHIVKDPLKTGDFSRTGQTKTPLFHQTYIYGTDKSWAISPLVSQTDG